MAGVRKGQRRDATKERHWRRMVRQWRRSGLNVREFCDWQNLSEPGFYFWRREIAKRDAEAAAARSRPRANSGRQGPRENAATSLTPAFLPVRVVADERTSAVRDERFLEVRLPTGVQLRVPAGFDRQTIVDVFAALQSSKGAPSC